MISLSQKPILHPFSSRTITASHFVEVPNGNIMVGAIFDYRVAHQLAVGIGGERHLAAATTASRSLAPVTFHRSGEQDAHLRHSAAQVGHEFVDLLGEFRFRESPECLISAERYNHQLRCKTCSLFGEMRYEVVVTIAGTVVANRTDNGS